MTVATKTADPNLLAHSQTGLNAAITDVLSVLHSIAEPSKNGKASKSGGTPENKKDGRNTGQLQTCLDQLAPRDAGLIYALLSNLRDFTEKMVDYFRIVTPPSGFPHDYSKSSAINLVLKQAGFDFNVISQSILQRLIFSDLHAQADEQATLWLEPAVKAGFFNVSADHVPTDKDMRQPIPIIATYLQKSPTTRVQPYSPVALIALPLTSTLQTVDRQSLAHEVGHLVFWKGSVQVEKDGPQYRFASFLNRWLRREKGISPFIADGVEQIVADMYGALVAGLPIAKTAQDLAALHTRERSYATDVRYDVTPELRPHIYEKTLELTGRVTKKELADLRARWQTLLAENYGPKHGNGQNKPPVTVNVGADYEVSYKYAKEELEEAVEYIYSFLKKVEPPTKAGSSIPKTALPTSIAEIQGTLGEYYPSQSFWTDANTALAQKQHFETWVDCLTSEEGAQQNAMRAAGMNDIYAIYSADGPAVTDWFTILYAGGWIMESPGNTNGPKVPAHNP